MDILYSILYVVFSSCILASDRHVALYLVSSWRVVLVVIYVSLWCFSHVCNLELFFLFLVLRPFKKYFTYIEPTVH